MIERPWIKAYRSRTAPLKGGEIYTPASLAACTIARKLARTAASQGIVDRLTAIAMSRAARARDFFGADLVYGYSGSASDMIKTAKANSKIAVLDQASATVGVASELMARAAEQWPEWPYSPIPASYRRMEEVELTYSDRIFAPSTFVQQSLLTAGVAAEKIFVLPYSISQPQVMPTLSFERPTLSISRPLKLLFVGTFGLQKGAPYLLEAVRRFGSDNVKLTVVGAVPRGGGVLEPFKDMVDFRGYVPRREMWAYYATSDVLCLPSVCEGFGLVQLEAMSYGLPVIASRNTGDVVEHGISGLLVEPMSVDSICEALDTLLSTPYELDSFSLAAKQRSKQFSFARYASGLIAGLEAVQ